MSKIHETRKITKHDAGWQALLRHDQLGSSRASSLSNMCLPKGNDERIMSNKSEEETRQQTVKHSNTLNNVVHQGDSRCEVSFSDDSCTESETQSRQDHCKNDSQLEHKQMSEDKANLCCNDIESLKCEVTKLSTKRLREPSDWIGVDEQSVASFNGNFESFLVNDNDEDITNSERSASVMSKMRYLTAIASLGGFLSGYNTGVISGAMLPVQRRFDLSREQEELVVTCAILSAFFSSLLGGTLNQSFGRKRTILGAAAVFVLGAFILLSAQNLFMLVCGEIALGLGIGLESLTSPMYIAEMAKPSIRGRLVSMYALLMCFGQVFAGIIDGSFSKMDGGWRYMFGFASLPGTLMFVGFLSLPESPAYLASKGSHVEATRVLSMLRDSDRDVEHEMEEIKLSLRMSGSTFASSSDYNDCDDDNQANNDTTKLEHDGNHKRNYSTMDPHCSSVNGPTIADDGTGATSSKGTTTMEHVTEMFRHTPTRRALTVGCGLMMLQQICGPNAVLYYAASIYEMAQFDETTSIWLSAFTAAAQIVGLIVSVYLVESVGRRLLVLSSLTLVALSSLGLGFSFYLARTSSEQVLLHESDMACQQQVARVWNGITSYCYDCVQIPGCGYCGGSCLQGNLFGPNDTNACPLESSSSWTYSTCTNPDGWMSVLFMVLFLLFFGVGMGGLPWTYNSEIYPVKYRSLAVGISTATNWIGNLLVSSTFLTLSSPAILTSYGSFYLYSSLSFMGVIWLYVVMPETKGLTLEEIQAKFALDLDDTDGNKTTKKSRPIYHQYSSDDCSSSIDHTSPLPLHYQSNQKNLHEEVSIPRTQCGTEECCRSSTKKRKNQASPPLLRPTDMQNTDGIPGAVTSSTERKPLLIMSPPTPEGNINYGHKSEEEEAVNHHDYYGSFSQPPSRYGSTTKNDPSSVSRYTKHDQHHHLNCAPSSMLAVAADDDNPIVLLPPRHKCVLAGIAA